MNSEERRNMENVCGQPSYKSDYNHIPLSYLCIYLESSVEAINNLLIMTNPWSTAEFDSGHIDDDVSLSFIGGIGLQR